METVASDTVVAAHAEFMQEFKDRKNSEWDLDYLIGLYWSHEEEPAKESDNS